MQGVAADRAVLRGEALMEGGGEGAHMHIKRFRACELPTDPAARFDALFNERPLWLWDDLEPYVSSMAVGGTLLRCCFHNNEQGTAEAVLLKFARVVQAHANDPIQYTRR